MNLIATSTARGTRIHRETCKRVKPEQVVVDLSDAQREEAFGASCCKPPAGAVQEVLEQSAAAAEVEATPTAESGPEWEDEGLTIDEIVENVESTREANEDDDVVTEAITADGVPKYFARWALRGGKVLAEALGITAERTKGTLVLTGPAEEVDRVQEVLFSAWEASYEAFKDWRKPREFYGNDDKVRWDTEVAFLEDFMLGVAASVRGATYAKDDAPEGVEAGLIWHRDR